MSFSVVEFRPTPTQKRFIKSTNRVDLYIGAMRGGKSCALVWSIAYHTKHNPGAHWLVVRDTWENLRRTTLEEFLRWFGQLGTFNKTEKEFTWKAESFSGKVTFIGLDDPRDAAKLQSMTLAGIAMDEVAPAVGVGGIPEDIFLFALTRPSQPDMKWRPIKLATNPPDESHWLFRRFVDPGTAEYKVFHADATENAANLPAGYYETLEKDYADRPDLLKRFVKGEWGFSAEGLPVTPEFRKEIHVAKNLVPVRGAPLYLLWDFGLNPTCLITQITPTGNWNFLEALVGDGIGVEQLIVDIVRPRLFARFQNLPIEHIGDPAGKQREQSDSTRTAVKVVRRLLGGGWRDGEVKELRRIQALRAVLRRIDCVKIDEQLAKPVWHAFRGGWCRRTHSDGTIGSIIKNIHSHPGDAASYGASVLYPLDSLLLDPKGHTYQPVTAAQSWTVKSRPQALVPREALRIG